MRRGTRVGQAYVEITADGDGINEEIVDSVNAAGDDVEKAGQDHGERYGEGFEEGAEPRLSKARKKIAKRFSDQFGNSGDEAGEKFTDTLRRHFDKVGDQLGRSLGERIAKALSNELEESFARMVDLMEDSVSGNGSGGGGSRPPGKYGPPPIEQRRLESAYRADRLYDLARMRMIEAAYKDNEAFDRRRTLMLIEAHRMNTQFNEGRRGGDGRVLPGGGRRGSGIGDTVGGFLGAGSRNNALNFFGRSIGNAITLVDKLRKGAGSMFTTFIKGFGDAEKGSSFFQRSMRGITELGSLGGGGAAGISKMFSSLAASGPAAAAAVGVVLVAMSALASVMGALVGLATALTATIVSGLTGAVLVLGGAFAAAAAAGGLLTAAFVSMTDAQKKMLSDAFKPLKEEFIGLGQLMIQDMVPAFDTWSKNLQTALALLGPAAQVMGDAFARAGNQITGALSGEGFERFAQAMTTWLPSITVNMSKAFGNFLNGAMGVFAALMPLVNRFSAYLVKVTEQFSKWANSGKGQNAIQDFANRAVESLQSLWNFSKQFFGFLSDVLFNKQSQKAGNSMFDSLAESFKRFRDAVERAAKNGDLKKWFDDAIKFGGDLKDMISALKDTFKALYNSGVLGAVGDTIELIATGIRKTNKVVGPLIDLFGATLPGAMQMARTGLELLDTWVGFVVGKFEDLVAVAGKVKDAIERIPSPPSLGGALGGLADLAGKALNGVRGRVAVGAPLSAAPEEAQAQGDGTKGGLIGLLLDGAKKRTTTNGGSGTAAPTIADLIAIGKKALNSAVKNNPLLTDPSKRGGSGGGDKDGDKKKFKNPWVEWAKRLIDNGPSIAAQLAAAMRTVNRQVARAMRQAANADDLDSARSILSDQMRSIRDTAQGSVDAARSALSSQAQDLASATGRKETAKALAQVRKAQRDLRTALKDQARLEKIAKALGKQKISTPENVDALLNEMRVKSATLADYAAARSRLAAKIDKANQDLVDAISMRDDYGSQLADSVRTFGALTTAQAQSINGVEQALTHSDITSNLQARLDKIRAFQANLNVLLSQGLSEEAYKQLLDAGVDTGSAFVDALVQGGQGAVAQVNSLVDQIGAAADSLGVAASSRLYQSGVDIAKGIVDGLNSQSKALDTAATALGDRIARAVRKALGIKSPSTKMIAMMDFVGDGAVIGLNNQTAKVENAAASLASRIAVTPSAARYAASSTGAEGVSGNGQKFRDLIIQTPTEDPRAVAMETLNEVTGRLG